MLSTVVKGGVSGLIMEGAIKTGNTGNGYIGISFYHSCRKRSQNEKIKTYMLGSQWNCFLGCHDHDSKENKFIKVKNLSWVN